MLPLSYPPSDPLFFWSVVAAACALALVVEAIVLFSVLSGSPKRREWRWFSLGPLAGGVVGVVLAQRADATYRYYHPLGGCEGVPPRICAAFSREAAQAAALYAALGWAMVALTVAVLVAGAVLLVRAARAR